MKPSRTDRGPQPYHHGNLRQALIDAGVELARAGGVDAIVLREAARRVGVSPNAAYRHFAALPDLVDAVGDRARAELAASIQRELARRTRHDDPRRDALEVLGATGRGYIHFALGDPGMFAVAFPFTTTSIGPAMEPMSSPSSPWRMLHDALDTLDAVGLLVTVDRPAAAAAAWAGVHGMAQLLLGPLSGLPPTQREALIATCLATIGRGLSNEPPPFPPVTVAPDRTDGPTDDASAPSPKG